MGHPQPTPHSYNLQPHNRNVHVTESKTRLTCVINHPCIYEYEYVHMHI